MIRDFVGYGPIDAFMADVRIEDVSCDGTGIPLFVFHQKYESIKTGVVFPDEDALNSFVVALGQRCGKQLSVAAPIPDGTPREGATGAGRPPRRAERPAGPRSRFAGSRRGPSPPSS